MWQEPYVTDILSCTSVGWVTTRGSVPWQYTASLLLFRSSYPINIMPWEGHLQAVLEPGSFSQCLHGHRSPRNTCHTKWRDFTLQHCCPFCSSCHSGLLQPTNILLLECSRKAVGIGLLFFSSPNLHETSLGNNSLAVLHSVTFRVSLQVKHRKHVDNEWSISLPRLHIHSSPW